MDVITFLEWLLDLIERNPPPQLREVRPILDRDVVSAIEVTVPGPGQPSIDKVFRILVEEA
jgi:hypothetical protein